MKKYLLITHYNWDGNWGLEKVLVFDSKEEARKTMLEKLDKEKEQSEWDDDTIVNATDQPCDFLAKEQAKLEVGELIYWEDFGDSIILSKYDDSSNCHIEWTIQEITLEV